MYDQLGRAEKELLGLVQRVLIRGNGWGPADLLRKRRLSIFLSPKQLSKHGQKLSPRTYQRAASRLIELGLLTEVGRDKFNRRIVIPAWWPNVTTENPVDIWAEAARRFSEQEPNASLACVSADAQEPRSCRPPVAPPCSADHKPHPHTQEEIADVLGATFARTSNSVTNEPPNDRLDRHRQRSREEQIRDLKQRQENQCHGEIPKRS